MDAETAKWRSAFQSSGSRFGSAIVRPLDRDRYAVMKHGVEDDLWRSVKDWFLEMKSRSRWAIPCRNASEATD